MGILRVILALCVYFVHTGWIGGFVVFPDRFRAVYSFFIISGFYMALILNRKYVGKKGSYLLFLSNRFLRIYPIYWAVVLATIIFSGVMLWRGVDTGDISGYVRYYAYLLHGHALMLPAVVASDIISLFTILFGNVLMIFHCGFFTRCSESSINNFSRGLSTLAMTWTLVLELLFYLIAPLLLRKKGLPARLGVIAGVFFLWFVIFHFRLLSTYSTAYIFMHAMKFFMLGFISFILYEKLPLKKIHPLALVGICLVFVVFMLVYAHIPLPNLRYKWLVFNDYIYYVSVVAAVPFLFQFSNLLSFDGFIGQLSYPIYISHLLTNEVLASTHIVRPHTQPFIITGLLCVLVFSFAVMYLLENPIDRFRQMRVAAAQVPGKLNKARQ
jgi:peptidoglycan/LPS O-acetylase OafA/YrhL